MKITSYDHKTCRDFKAAVQKEWREENDLGAYASSTILGANTKSNHGLLVVPDAEPKSRNVLLSSIEETLFIGERGFPLSTHIYSDNSVFPKGYEFLESFYLAPYPTWIYRVEGLAFMKILLVLQGENTTVIRYQLLSSYGDYVRLQIRPIGVFRSIKGVNGPSEKSFPRLDVGVGTVTFTSDLNRTRNTLYVHHNAGVVDRSIQWFRKLQYSEDTSRQQRLLEEDLTSLCSLLYAFHKEDGVYLCISTRSKLDVGPLIFDIHKKVRGRTKTVGG